MRSRGANLFSLSFSKPVHPIYPFNNFSYPFPILQFPILLVCPSTRIPLSSSHILFLFWSHTYAIFIDHPYFKIQPLLIQNTNISDIWKQIRIVVALSECAQTGSQALQVHDVSKVFRKQFIFIPTRSHPRRS